MSSISVLMSGLSVCFFKSLSPAFKILAVLDCLFIPLVLALIFSMVGVMLIELYFGFF